MLNVGSLFSGVGGIDLGLERAGHRIVFQCEKDKWCRGILAKHWPAVRAPSELPGRVDDPKPDGPRYAQMGNAVTVNVAHWIGLRLAAVERERLAA